MGCDWLHENLCGVLFVNARIHVASLRPIRILQVPGRSLRFRMLLNRLLLQILILAFGNGAAFIGLFEIDQFVTQ